MNCEACGAVLPEENVEVEQERDDLDGDVRSYPVVLGYTCPYCDHRVEA